VCVLCVHADYFSLSQPTLNGPELCSVSLVPSIPATPYLPSHKVSTHDAHEEEDDRRDSEVPQKRGEDQQGKSPATIARTFLITYSPLYSCQPSAAIPP
jgi:hypothetical protein